MKTYKIKPSFSGFKEKLKQKYVHLNSTNSENFGLSIKASLSKKVSKVCLEKKKKKLIYSPNKEQSQIIFEIFKLCKKTLIENIVEILPKKPIFMNDSPEVKIL